MLTDLREAIEKLEDPVTVDGELLVELFALRDRLDAYTSTQVAVFDRDVAYATDGAVSTASWLRHHCRMAHTDANRVATRDGEPTGAEPGRDESPSFGAWGSLGGP